MNMVIAYAHCQLKRYLRTPVALIWTFVFPVLLFILYGGAHAPLAGSIGAASYAGFLLPGIIGLSAVSTGLFGLGLVLVQAREHGVMQRLALTPQPAWVFVCGHLLSAVVIVVLIVIVLMGIGWAAFHVEPPKRLGLWSVALMAGSLTFLSIGCALAALLPDSRTAQVVVSMVFFLSVFLGDVWMPSQALPASVQSLVSILPLSHFLSLLRNVGLHGDSLQAGSTSLIVLMIWSLVAVAIALHRFRRHDMI